MLICLLSRRGIRDFIQQCWSDGIPPHIGLLNDDTPSGKIDACGQATGGDDDFQNAPVVSFSHNVSFFNGQASIYKMSVRFQQADSARGAHTVECNAFHDSLGQSVVETGG